MSKPNEKTTRKIEEYAKNTAEKEREIKTKDKQRLPQCSSLTELVSVKEPRAMVVKRLPYKGWRLYVFRNNDRFTVRITAFRNKKMYVKLNIAHNDVKYLRELLEEIENAFRKLGFGFSTL